MNEDQFERLMRDAAVSYNRPSEPPLEEMWAEIVPAPVERPSRWTMWRAASLAAAAALVLGIALGRASSRMGGARGIAMESQSVAEAQPASRPRAQEALATSQYIGQTTALLIALPSELQRRHPDSGFVARANDLLLTTRLAAGLSGRCRLLDATGCSRISNWCWRRWFGCRTTGQWPTQS